jgi:hypothetical protein
VNFTKAYESVNKNAITWYEFQFGKKNNLHYDAIIINKDEKEILLIESKRFSNVNEKIKETEYDIKRINASLTEYYDDFNGRIPEFDKYTVYGVVLADVWTETFLKTNVRDAFLNSEFLDVYLPSLLNEGENCFLDGEYFCLNFDLFGVAECINENYHLLGMIWKLKK